MLSKNLRRKRSFKPKFFIPVVVASLFYASIKVSNIFYYNVVEQLVKKEGAKNNSNGPPHEYYEFTKEDISSWMDTTGVTMTRILGDQTTCKDVIYTADTRPPTSVSSHVAARWEILYHIMQTFPIFNQTCAAFFKVSEELYGSPTGLHPVWARLPATAIAMTSFTAASYFLYMDTDAMLSSPKYAPSEMFRTLSFDGYGENATFKFLEPSLIANKPLTGWLCSQCENFGLGHGCFNSGALLWRRSEGARLVLKAWWESRLHNSTQNFHEEEHGSFHGWSQTKGQDGMSEQNRLMYIFHTDPVVQRVVWPVPRQISKAYNSSSCPNTVDTTTTPCLQNDFSTKVKWNSSGSSCFINHYADHKSSVQDALGIVAPSHPMPLEKYMYDRRIELIDESSVLHLDASQENLPTRWSIFHHNFTNDMGLVQTWKDLSKSNASIIDGLPEWLVVGKVCDAIKVFTKTGGTKKHALVAHMNENWGAFSAEILTRTAHWGGNSFSDDSQNDGCGRNDLLKYLNHSNTLAIFTTTHQNAIDPHPNVFSLPLGVSRPSEIARKLH